MRNIVQCSIIFPIVAIGLGACSTPNVAHQPASISQPWHPVDETTGQIADVDGLTALADAFPNSSSVRLRLLNAYVAAEYFATALSVAERLAGEGYAFSPAAREYLQGLLPTDAIPQWLATNGRNSAPIGSSQEVATIPEEARLPEGLAILGEGHFAISTVISREVWLNDDGNWVTIPTPGAGNLSGIAAKNGGLVVASSDLGMLPGQTDHHSGLIELLEHNTSLLIAAPEGIQLSDLAVFRDQTVFASDPLEGGVYRAGESTSEIETVVAPGTLRSPQGIAPSQDGSRLYVSDYRYGLAIIDLETGEVSRLAADTPMLLDGIDGLWLHGGELIAIQNGLSPRRIVGLRLSEDGNRIVSLRVLEQANPEWTEPLGGDIHEGALYYIGNGSWDLFEEGGSLREGAELHPTAIRRLELIEKPTD